MSFRFASLGSGSEGNALIVQVGDSTLMMDCGFGVGDTEKRLARLGLAPDDLNAIVVTHEHTDHIGGVARFARKYHLPVWMTHGTMRMMRGDILPKDQLHFVDPHATLVIDAIEVMPYLVPHDANEPVQYVFGDGVARLGVLTDTGATTAHIEAMLSGCDALVLECNHDLDMLMNGPYPASLKRRVAGRFGHLDNAAAATLLGNIDCSRLKHLVAAHLSKRNNHPDLARAALAGVLDCDSEWIAIADQDAGLAWRVI